MMYDNLFNPSYQCEYGREWETRWTIRFYLKEILKNYKRGYHNCAVLDGVELRGMLKYMTYVGDIEPMQAKFLAGITWQMKRKYRKPLY